MKAMFPSVVVDRRLSMLRRWKKRAGAALVFVLIAVVLVTVLTLAFMASVAMERQASFAYANSSEVRMLAESAVNLVIGQIRQASEQANVVWTSQPGLLRTFDQSGTPLRAYKLYSSRAMSPSASAFNPAADVPTDWTSRPAEYVDLNRPVVSRVAGTSYTNYSILDPGGVGKIEGFSTNGWGHGVSMPVAWMYVLQDGTITNSTGMTKANPPVARIAFWTDDETGKLNINTASEGFFWDVPHSGTPDDKRMAWNQPVQREYQGYPGHPATTSLSPVLWGYFKDKNSSLVREPEAGNTNTFPEALYAMLPRTTGGGSRGGTEGITNVGTKLNLKDHRLFASVDEMAFLATTNSALRQTNALIDRDEIEETRFFLTAHSRAPELNLFNKPRVTIWPTHAETSDLHRTPYDKLIAFASTLNSNAFYLTRADSTSPTADFSGRNVEIYQYLQDLTGNPVPGFGGSFLTKYGDDRDQILTEIFDYIRCVNILDSSVPGTNFVTYTPRARVSTGVGADGGTPAGSSIPARGTGQVVPLIPGSGQPGGGTKGFGRFQTINRALFVLGASTNLVNTNAIPATTNTVTKAALFFETFNPALGPAVTCPDYTIRVTTPEDFLVVSGTNGAVTNAFSFSGDYKIDSYPTVNSFGRNYGGYEGFAVHAMRTYSYIRTDQSNSGRKYPFVSAAFTNAWNSETPTIEVKEGEVRAEVIGPQGDVIQTIRFDFPSFAAPMPKPETVLQPDGQGYDFRFGTANGINARGTGSFDRISVGEPGAGLLRGPMAKHWITTNDVARSLEATGMQGDLRLLAAQTGTTNIFQPVQGYANLTAREYSALSTLYAESPWGQGVHPFASVDNKRFGRLVSESVAEGNIYHGTSYVPPGINGVTNVNGAPGDWDTAIGIFANGPLINKPDDGDIFTPPGYPPYMHGFHSTPPGETFSSPSRQIPSAVMFGSLPTGVKATPQRPWQTLLFCPNPASHYGVNASAHPGETSPKDHLFLDLFHMPVVEPYAISEPFSTAGKVNMNYQIIPFTGIERKTALHGVLNSVKVTAVDDFAGYKAYLGAPNKLLRYRIDISGTLDAYFATRFATNGVFLSASEICEIPLLPEPVSGNPWTTAVTPANLDSFWAMNKQTGDNLRENPYTRIYPRLTTRSNTYTVHVWVETLKKIPGTPPDQWMEGIDKVTGQFRGSFLIERYLNPSDPIPDYATQTAAENINEFYRFRVVNSKTFNP